MTQVVTISANTAALNIEVLKVPRRLSIKDRVEDVKADADRNARRAADASDVAAVEAMVPAPTVGIDLLTTGQQPRQQATIQEAQAAYREMED
jgi:hypothetical protein